MSAGPSQNRQPAGVPVGGQYATSARSEADVALDVSIGMGADIAAMDHTAVMEFLNRNRLHPALRGQIVSAEYPTATLRNLAQRVRGHEQPEFDSFADQARALAAEAGDNADAQRALAQRLEAAKILLEYPDGATVSTLNWPEEPNDDGTFDVAFNEVYIGEDSTIERLGDLGSVPAGWLTGDGPTDYRTAYDTWREDANNPDSDIEVAKVRAWSARLGARVNETPEQAYLRDLNERAANAQMTRYADMKPGDLFVREQYDGPYIEVEVTGAPVDAKDLFGRSMKNLPCKRLDTGEEGPLMYGPEGVCRKVTPPTVERPAPAPRTLQA